VRHIELAKAVVRGFWRPENAHPLIVDAVITASRDQATTHEDRKALIRAGMFGLLDTATVPTETVLAAIAGSRLLHFLARRGTHTHNQVTVPAVSHALCVMAGIVAWQQGARGDTGRLFLAGTHLREADLTGIDLRCTNLDGANLAHATLRHTNFEGNSLRLVDFTRADLCYANLRDTYLGGADMRGASMRYVDLTGASMRNARLMGTDLSFARLSDADLASVNMCFADLPHTDLSRVNLAGSYLCSADLTGADLRYADLSGCDLRDADLCYADLRGVVIDHTDFTGANMCGAQWSDLDRPPGWGLSDGRLYPVDAG
jgi:uncharacterized protein YjbI with pentapeptide repeats